MASKEFIGPVDCYAALLPDEEYFLLMARDPIAAGLTMIWASLRVGDVQTALDNFTRMADPNLVQHYARHPDKAKSEEAVEVAQRMVDWRERNLKGWDGRPTWKSRRAVGVERFVLAYVERLPAGPQRINIAFDEWPLWAKTLRAPEPEAAKIACGLRQVADSMMADGMDAMVNGESADRIRGFAAELELIAGKPLILIPTMGATDGERQPPAETEGDCA